MANTFNLGNKKWAVKEDQVLAYNSENNNFKPLPFDFTRASDATVVNKAGLIETVGSGEPRIDFLDNTDGALLLEPSRQNIVFRSEDIDTGWSKLNVTVVNNSIISPDGSLSAGLSTATSTSAQHASYDTFSASVTPSSDYFISCFVKKSTTRYVRLNEGFSGATLNFDLDNGALVSLSAGATDEIIENYGNGWYRIGFNFTSNSSGNSQFALYINDNSNTNLYAGAGEAVYIWGAQIEEGSYATSYIPTSGSAVTRVADTCSGAGNDQVFDNNTSVLFIDFSRFIYESGINTSALTLRNSSDSEQIRFHFDFPSKVVRFRDAKNGFTNIGGLIATETNIRKKVALKIDGTTLKVFADGSQIGSDYTRPTAFDFYYINLGSSGDKLFDIKYYNTALTDAELIALTT